MLTVTGPVATLKPTSVNVTVSMPPVAPVVTVPRPKSIAGETMGFVLKSASSNWNGPTVPLKQMIPGPTTAVPLEHVVNPLAVALRVTATGQVDAVQPPV